MKEIEAGCRRCCAEVRSVSALDAKFALPCLLGRLLCVAGLMSATPAPAYDVGVTLYGSVEPVRVFAISADGNTAVGDLGVWANNFDGAARFDASGKMVLLPPLSDSPQQLNNSQARGISGDGSIIAGWATDVGGGAPVPVYWSRNSVTRLPTLGSNRGTAYGVSADGSTIVGENYTNAGTRAVVWKSGGAGYALIDVGVSLSASSSTALAASTDGSVVVGSADQNGVRKAVVWTFSGNAANPRIVESVFGGPNSLARGVSGDGGVVVGAAQQGNAKFQAFRWSGGTMTGLGFLPGHDSSQAWGISQNGRVIVGDSTGSSGLRAFRWTERTGMQTIEDWLSANGVTVGPSVPTTTSAVATSADGSVVVGQAGAWGFIARVLSSDSGLLVLDSALARSLNSTGNVTQSLLSSSETIMNGMHSLPLDYRVAKGQSTFWGGGDWGAYTQYNHDGNVGVGEIGGGYNFGPVQFNVALGYSQNRQSLSPNGTQKSSGTYLYGESLLPLFGDLWSVLSGYYQWGSIDLARDYLNAGNLVSSTGSPDTISWALRARLEWDGLADVSGFRLNPYAELSYARARMNGYAETTGAFPASFDARTDTGTDLRLGVNGALPLDIGKQTRLFGVLEGVYRFEERAANVTGKLLGPGGFGFSFPGVRYDQAWARAGIGIESMIGNGKAVVSLNGATRGESPNIWLNIRYQLAF